MIQFNELGLAPILLKAIEKMGFQSTTEIQAQTIPAAMEGKDVLATAQTGSGKTCAFAVPLLQHLLHEHDKALLVLTPTRELATQVMSQFKELLFFEKSIRTALLIGGESIQNQFKQLKGFPRVVVGTPGRVNDHLKRGTLRLSRTPYLVLDETDRMLDMGFGPQLETILEKLPEERQTLMFSATLPTNIEKLSKNYLKDPTRITVGNHSTPCANIDQETIHLSEQDKYPRLLEQLESKEGSIIVFVKTKRGADKLSDQLNRMNLSSDAIHGDLRQNKRDRVIAAFRKQKYRIIVATDVAARGLDIPHIRHVINYDLPQCPEDYIHRIGRTARAGATGTAMSFITPRDRGIWKAISMLIDPDAEQPRVYNSEGKTFSKSKGKPRYQSRDSSSARPGNRKKPRFSSKKKSERNNLQDVEDFIKEQSPRGKPQKPKRDFAKKPPKPASWAKAKPKKSFKKRPKSDGSQPFKRPSQSHKQRKAVRV